MLSRKIVLVSRPHGLPKESDFALREEDLREPGEGEVLIAVEHLSIDAFIRTMLDAREGLHGSIDLETPVMALGVGRVLRSRTDDLAVGDHVFGPLGAQTHALGPAAKFRRLSVGDVPARAYLGALGLTTGLTAYAGMICVGEVAKGETVVVSAAAGAVGSIACQLAKIAGARVIGIAGGPAKVDFLLNRIGCDAAIDYKAGDVARSLAELAPQGVDVYFDNVGGELLDTVLDRIATGARVVLCGAISQYNHMERIRGPALYLRIAERNSSMRGFTVDRFAPRFPEFEAELSRLLREGRLLMPEHTEQGIERFPAALIMLLSGQHMGKLLVAI